MKIGIIGNGYFGKKIYTTLKKNNDICFFTGHKMQGIRYDVEWVVIASSTASHYELCKQFIQNKVNVFVEKPMTTSYEKSIELVSLAKHNNVQMYVDDIFVYNNKIHNLSSNDDRIESAKFTWFKHGSFTDNIYNNLVYHDIYIALFLKFPLTGPIKFLLNHVHKKQFRIGNVEFEYDRLFPAGKIKRLMVNKMEYDLNTSVDLLELMFGQVFNGKVDFDENIQRSLQTQQIIEQLKQNTPTVAVVGGGIFGITAALELSNSGLCVELFEKNQDILQNASAINQYRLHKGYHYPRSYKTSIAAKNGTDTFLKEFQCETEYRNQHYAIAKRNSKVNSDQYEEFMNSMNLKYEKVHSPLINEDNIENLYSVKERLFSPKTLYAMCRQKLDVSDVTLHLGTEFNRDMIDNYDYTVICTYANLNSLLPVPTPYQFEICEKPIVKLPDKFKGVGIVIMDGPFMCIDPYENSDWHVLGNVVHAIHSTNVGILPEIPNKFLPLLNKGIVVNPPVTNFNKFVETCHEFLNVSGTIEHIGSMFTVRTVLANRDHDDARPTIVQKHEENLFSLFSGKISTCVDTAKQIKIHLQNN